MKKKYFVIIIFVLVIFVFLVFNGFNNTKQNYPLNIGDGFAEDLNYIYEEGRIVFDLKQGKNSFDETAKIMQEINGKSDDKIKTIIETYYTLTLPEDLETQEDIFTLTKTNKDDFFLKYQKGLKNLKEWSLYQYPAFRRAFVIKDSPAYKINFPYPTGHYNERVSVLARKIISDDTMIVYGSETVSAYGGPAGHLCKERGISIDRFTFKKISNEWRIWNIEENIDSWTTQNEGSTEEECKEINQDRIKKYQISD